MLSAYQSIILGIVQGITEWLPISSSGHLVLAQRLFQLEVPVAFDVLLHIATLIVILAFFYKDITRIISAVVRWKTSSYEFRLAGFVILASITTAIIVLIFKNFFEKAFSSLIAVGAAFIVTGMLLFFSERNVREKKIIGKSAVLVGAVQAVAFLPGISRSGSTISSALMLGIKKQDAFKFSFLILIIPAFGAGILKAKELAASTLPAQSLIAGFASALIVGFLSLNILMKVVMQERFHYFAYYCWFIGILTLILHFVL